MANSELDFLLHNKYTVVVTGDKVNRDYAKTRSDTVGSDYDSNATAIGAKYAMYKTFQQRLGDNGFITTPNLKPYFIRMTNKSVANSVKKRGDYTSTAAKVTVRKAVADLGDQLQDILDKTSYDDKTYSDFSDVVKKDTSPFFTQNMASKSNSRRIPISFWLKRFRNLSVTNQSTQTGRIARMLKMSSMPMLPSF